MEKPDKPINAVRYSVIVPTYNSGHTLTACLQSLTNQTLPKAEYEIIVVDDGSTDDTATIVAGFEVNYIVQTNHGPAVARNQGVQHATGEIILFTDADCVPDHNWIQEMVRPFQDAEVVGVKGTYKTKQKELSARFAQAEFEDRYDLLKKHATIDMVDTYSAAFRKDIFLKMGGFDESFPVANNEDTDLSYRLAAAGYKLVFNPKAFVGHTHQNSLLNYLKLKFWRGYWRMVVYKRYPDKAIQDSYTPAVLKIQTLLMAISLAGVPLMLVHPLFLDGLVLLWGIILLSSLPFALKTFKQDKHVGLIAPGVVFLRSMVFAIGSVCGMAWCIYKDKINLK